MAFAPMTDADYPNLANLTQRLDPDGSIAAVGELLQQYNPILNDIPIVEGNLPTGHRSTVRTDLPTPTWRKLYQGVKPTKSGTAQVDDTLGNLEDYAGVDKDLADLNGNTAAFRLSENTPHIESMSNTMATTLFYGDTVTDPEKFLGLSPRYDSLTISSSKPTATTRSGQLTHVIDGGGSSDLTSLWLVCWGPQTVFGIYPKGSQIGLLVDDQGEQRLSDDDGGWFQGYVTHYKWQLGLVVKDWRYIVRVANIDVTDMDTAATQVTLYKNMVKALHTIPQGGSSNKVFYCGAVVAAMLDLAAMEKSNVALTRKEVFGEELTHFRGIPIRQCDAIIEDEAAVS